jgi:hypothetical protein
MGLEDGNYSATGSYKTEDESTNPWTYRSYSDVTTQSTIGGYVQLTGVSWNPTSIPWNGNSQFTVNLLASNSCTGGVTLQDVLSAIPPGLTFSWNGLPQTTTLAYGSVFGGLVTAIPVTLNLSTNTVVGTVSATGYLYSLPPGCQPRDPPSPAQRTATLTLTSN